MNKKVLVIGEFCKDVFIYGKSTRLNPEAPTPVFVPEYEEFNLGMAGNVYNNLNHLGLDVCTLEECNDGEITKTRMVDTVSNYILLRVDTGDDTITPITFRDINESYDLGDYGAIVISDYNKGFIAEDELARLFLFAKAKRVPTFMDTKKAIGAWAEDCTYIKINESEYNNPKHKELPMDTLLRESLIVTMGSNGAKYKDKIYETKKVSVRDVTGAGDTFLSGLVYGYLKYGNIYQAIDTANQLASNVVSKKGVALPDID